jgi:hypothetical protein
MMLDVRRDNRRIVLQLDGLRVPFHGETPITEH